MSSPEAVDARERILRASQELFLRNGFSGTTVDMVVADARVTKGGFFYHFKTKADLARAVGERAYVNALGWIGSCMEQGERLGKNPVEQLILGLRLCEEFLERYDGPWGCFIGVASYQLGLLPEEATHYCRKSVLTTRDTFRKYLDRAVSHRTPVRPIDSEALADHFYAILEGAFVLSRVMDDRAVFSRQMAHYRLTVELLFNA